MPSVTPPYLIRHLDGRSEYDTLSAQIMDWRRARSLPTKTLRPMLTTLRDEREIAVLVDTHDDTVVGCLHLHRAPLPTPPWTDAS